MTKLILSMSALAPSQYRKYVKGWDKGRYADLFAKYNGDRKGYRIYLPLDGRPTKIAVPEEIQQAIHSRGYVVDDYRAGLAVDSSGKRKIKIGKLLPQELQQVFANDPARQAKSDAYTVVISRHPYDIAGMSTGRGWTSCMNLKDGSNRKYVEKDVTQGSLIAYLVRSDDLDVKNPAARILLRVYTAGSKTGLWPSNTYGTGSAQFYSTLRRWCAMVNVDYFGIPYGISMQVLKSLYADGADRALNLSPDMSLNIEELRKLLTRRVTNAGAAHIQDVCVEVLRDDPVAFFKSTGKFEVTTLQRLSDCITPDVLNSSVRIQIQLPNIPLSKLNTAQAYSALLAKYWKALPIDSVLATKLVPKLIEVMDLKLVSGTDFTRVATECDWDSVLRVNNIPTVVIQNYKSYGIPSDTLAAMLSALSDVDMPKRVDPDLVRAITVVNMGARGCTNVFAKVGSPDAILTKLLGRPRCADNPNTFKSAINRLAAPQVQQFIEAQGGVFQVLQHPYIWFATKWRTQIATSLFKALYKMQGPQLTEFMANYVAGWPLATLALLCGAKQVGGLGDSQRDIRFTACLLAATLTHAVRIADTFALHNVTVSYTNALGFAWATEGGDVDVKATVSAWLALPPTVRSTLIECLTSIVDSTTLQRATKSTSSTAWKLLAPWRLKYMAEADRAKLVAHSGWDPVAIQSLIEEVQ